MEQFRNKVTRFIGSYEACFRMMISKMKKSSVGGEEYDNKRTDSEDKSKNTI